MTNVARLLLGACTLGVIAAGAFIVVQLVRAGSDDTEDEQAAEALPQSTTSSMDELQKLIEADMMKPRFSGEVIGIWISPSDQTPDTHRLPVHCDGSTKAVADDRAGNFDLEVEMPRGFTLLRDDPDTGVIAWMCDEHVYAARWAYDYEFGGKLIIARGEGRSVSGGCCVAEDRVEVVDAGGRQAVLINPIRTEGNGQLGPDGTQTTIAFPEPFGVTEIYAIGVPLSAVLDVANRVGQVGNQ
jgi:hypothetical protein